MDLCLMADNEIANLSGAAKAAYPASNDVLRWFDELRDPLRRYLICAGADHADADEAVQETFLKLHLQLRKNAELTNVRAWVFAVARNCVRDARKSAHFRRTVVLDDAMKHQSSFIDPGSDPEHSALREERSLRLSDAVGKLPERERECILLRSSGLRYREIAEILGIETNRIGGLLLRAVTHLREGLS
jgi:RNA polymerase sigma-70 factor (ECF subfamily)